MACGLEMLGALAGRTEDKEINLEVVLIKGRFYFWKGSKDHGHDQGPGREGK